MRWEQLKGSSWVSEQTRECHCVADALYNEVPQAEQAGKASGAGSPAVGMFHVSGYGCG